MTGVEAAKALPGLPSARPAEAGASRAVQSFASIFEAARQQNRAAQADSSRADRIEEMNRRHATQEREPTTEVDPSARKKRVDERGKSSRVDRLKTAQASDASGPHDGAEIGTAQQADARAVNERQEIQDRRGKGDKRPTPARPGSHAHDTSTQAEPASENTASDHPPPEAVVGLTPLVTTSSTRGGANPADASGPTLPMSAAGREPLEAGLTSAVGVQRVSSTRAAASSAGFPGATASTEAAPAVQAQPPANGETQGRSGGHSTEFLSALNAASARRSAGTAQRSATMSAASSKSDSVASLRLDSPKAMEELAAVVRARAGGRNPSVTLQLDPPELGKVRVDVRMHDQLMIVRFHAQTEAGHDALAARIGDLREALDGQGIRLDRLEVEYRPPPPANPSREDPQNPQQPGTGQWGNLMQEGQRQEGAWQDGRPQSAGGYEGSDYPTGDMAAGEESDYVGRLAESGVDLRV
ncbi:MAG: hypothetical protein AMXMBFR13_47260 [Phycisphaerae bacterium]